jgi:hypothetical protein
MDDWFDASETRRHWPIAPDKPRPVIFLRELRLVSALDTTEPIRCIEFHPGLNIVWADPKVNQARRRGGVRMAGHSAGKTTLCRILRWLLGEAHFGSDELENAVGVAFPRGWALLHVELDGAPWVIGRPFWQTSDHRAAPSATLDQVLATGWPEQGAKDEFFAELKRLTLVSLVRQRFPDAKDDIEFTDLLGWLARDQEAALQRVDSWRATTSGNMQRTPDKADRHILMRLVLELLEGTEWEEMEKCAGLEAKKDEWKKKEPGLIASAKAACEPLARLIGTDVEGLEGPLVVSSAEQAVKDKEATLSTFREQLGRMELKKTEEELEETVGARVSGEKEVLSIYRRVKQMEKKVSERNADLVNAKTKARAKLRMPPGFCSKLRDEAKNDCPLYEEMPESLAAAETAAEIQQRRDHLQEILDDERQELADAESRLPFLREREAQLRTQRNEVAKSHDRVRWKIAELEAALKVDKDVLSPAQTRQAALDHCQNELARLNEAISKSKETQRSIRQEKWQERNRFADSYRAALKQLLGPKSDGHLDFDGEGLFQLIVNKRGRSGSAVDALKVLAFDLGAMLWSVSGKSHHPRLLIHDSPRVADMSPIPYTAIFDLVAAAEGNDNSPTNFQYIITTTESPPVDLHDRHLVVTLDASEVNGLLFKREFE